VLTLRFAQSGAPAPLPDVLQAPTNLVASADSNQVSLRWIDNASAELGYSIERCFNGTGNSAYSSNVGIRTSRR